MESLSTLFDVTALSERHQTQVLLRVKRSLLSLKSTTNFCRWEQQGVLRGRGCPRFKGLLARVKGHGCASANREKRHSRLQKENAAGEELSTVFPALRI